MPLGLMGTVFLIGFDFWCMHLSLGAFVFWCMLVLYARFCVFKKINTFEV